MMKPVSMCPLLISLLLLSACGGGDGNSTRQSASASAPAVTVTNQQKLTALEDSGAIPKLERTPSLQGIDANTSGVRDDVEAFIATHYSTPPQQQAALQLAGVLQASLLVDKNEVSAVHALAVRGSRAVNCIYDRFDGQGGSKQPAEVVKEIESITSNTKERLLAYLAYNSALDGTAGALPVGDTCE